MRRVVSRFFIAVIILSPSQLLAGEAVDIGHVVVSADLYERDVRETPHSVTVITRRDIARGGAANTAEALRGIAGVTLSSLGAPAEDLDLRVRGSDRDEVLVLLDGVPLNNVIESRAVLLESLPVDLIERIELVRGAQSVLYGGSAGGGVVNIVTRKARGRARQAVSFMGGNLGFFKETVYGWRRFGAHGFSASYSRHDDKGRFTHDRFGGNAAFLNYECRPSSIFTLQAHGAYLGQEQDLAFGSAISFAAFPTVNYYITRDFDRNYARRLAVSGLSAEFKPLDWYAVRFSYGLQFEDLSLDNSNAGEPLPEAAATLDTQSFDSLSHRHGFELRHTFTPAGESAVKFRFTAGAAVDLEYLKYTDAPFPSDVTAETTTVFPDATLGQKGSRRNIAGYALTDATVADRFTLSLGLRYDDNSTYGSAVSPRVSAAVEIPPFGTRIFGGVSRGFFAPTLNQYYLAVIGGTLTQRLDKEESSSFELGVRQDFLDSRLSAEATFFYTDYDTFINEVQLVPSAHVIGGEFAIHARPLAWLETALNYTAMNAENDADGASLSYRPEHRANVELTATPFKRWDITATARYTGTQAIAHVLSTQALGDLQVAFFDANGVPAGDSLPAHFILGLSSRYTQKIGKPWLKELVYSARAFNLTNASYEEKFGYPMPRFRFTAGVEARF